MPKDLIDSLLRVPRISQPVVSPDGKWVAWTWLNITEVGDVYVTPTDGSTKPTRVTNTGNNTWIGSWLPDSSGLVVLHDQNGDEKDQLFLVKVDNPLVLTSPTEPNTSYYSRGGVLDPSGENLFYAANHNFTTQEGIEAFWLYRQSTKTGEKTVLARPVRSSYYVPQLNVDGTHVLYSRSDINPSGQQIWLAAVDGSSDREIINEGPTVQVRASWSADGQSVIIVADHNDYKRVGVWRRATEEIEWLIDDPERAIENAFMPPLSEYIVVEEVENARIKTTLLNIETKEHIAFPAHHSKETKVIGCTSGGLWICMQSAASQPDELVSIRLDDSGASLSLSNTWEYTDLRPGSLIPAESIWWKSSDGLEIQGWLYNPRTKPKGTILYIHGGPTGRSVNALNPEIQYYLSQGFTVLDPNYRGSTGFGLAFQNAIKKDGWGGMEQQDIVAGARALLSQGVAEPGKIAITGTSYGGYSAWHAITHYPDIFMAAVPISGMVDLIADYNATRPDLRSYIKSMMGDSPTALPRKYRQRSPINYLKNIKGRVLIVQGLHDPNVTLESVKTVEDQLQSLGIQYELLVFDNEGHGIQRPNNIKVLLQRTATFLTKVFEE